MSSDEQAIRAAVAIWVEASIDGDLARVLALMDDEVVFLAPGRPPMRKAEFSAASKGMAGKVRIDGVSDVQEVRVFGEWACVWTQLSMTIQRDEDEDAVHRAGPGLSIWRKQPGGAWVIFRDANMATTQGWRG